MKPYYLYRSAITGKFVSREYAEANPKTTVRVKVKKKCRATT